MSDATQQIKDRLSIVDVVSSYVKLEKAGKNFKAKSPFSSEKTPSFYVSPDRGMYYCFSTGQGGDIFTFVQKMEGVDFRGALKLLAERAGVELRPESREGAGQRERLFSILEMAASFFEQTLRATPEAAAYVRQRGISEKSQVAWRIGYAPAGWSTLLQYLKEKGFKETEIELAGLIKRSEKGGGFYDRFRGRIIFPISDTSGRVIAYTGRILPWDGNPEYKSDTAKYLNSPETPLFSKSRQLYGYHLAKHAIRTLGCSILVEGQMDVVLSHQAGYTNTVAVSGTALTAEQLGLLARLSNNLVVAFDADRAGIASAGKGIALALGRGMDVKVAALPKGDDPADLVRRGTHLWKEIVRSAKHVIDFYLDYLAAEHPDPRRLRLAVGETVLPFVAFIPNKIDQAHFVARIAERLGLREEPVWEELRKRSTPAPAAAGPDERAVAEPLSARKEAIEERLAVLLWWQRKLPEAERALDVVAMEERMRAVLGEERFDALLSRVSDEENKVLFEIEMLYDGTQTLRADIEDLLVNLEQESNRQAYTSALESLREAERSGDAQAVAHWSEQCNRLRSTLEVSRAGPQKPQRSEDKAL